MTTKDLTLIMPLGGQSSRFPGMRPKWMLVNPAGNMMLADAILGLDISNVTRILFIVLKEHDEKFQAVSAIEKQFKKLNLGKKIQVVALDKVTSNQPETIYLAVKKRNIEGAVFIKDCDNSFETQINIENSVSVFDLNAMELVHAKNKSYVSLNDEGFITSIVEKRVISSSFCVGGYSFEDVSDFVSSYERLKDEENLYVSHIIYDLVCQNYLFKSDLVKAYSDWGTLVEWNNYKSQYSTLFVDIDGTLVMNGAEYFDPEWGTTDILPGNADVINKLYDSGKSKIILTTSRNSQYKEATEKQLSRLGIKYHQIIFDLYHAKRIVINDYSKSNPYKSCDAVNILRNSDTLADKVSDTLNLKL